MKSLNGKKGTTINELEAMLLTMRKLVKDKLKDNPKAGLILCKGEPGETRIRYRELLGVIDSLETRFGLEGCFSFGICKTCDRYSPGLIGSEHSGQCPLKGAVHEYSSCDKHSKSGGGFGL